MSPTSDLSIPDPEWTQFSSNFPVPSLVGSAIQLRQMMAKLHETKLYTQPVGQTIQDLTFLRSDGSTGVVRRYSPLLISQPARTIAYLYGGGWTLGDLDSEDETCRSLCAETGSIVVSIDYRKAPENPFPVPLEDAWASVLWVVENMSLIGGSADELYLAGNSAGANMASALTQRARDEGTISFRGLILRNPMVCHPEAHPKSMRFDSWTENKDAPFLSAEAVRNFTNFYNPPPTDPRFSSLLANSFQGLPPTYIQVSGADPLRDDGTNYAQKLREAGVPVKIDIYPGLPHAFFIFPLRSAKKCNADLINGYLWLTSQVRASGT